MRVLMSLYMAASNLERSGTTLTPLMDHEIIGHCGIHHWEWRMKMFVHVLCGCVWPMYLGGADLCVCVRVCVHVCVRACVRACVHIFGHAYVCVCVYHL